MKSFVRKTVLGLGAAAAMAVAAPVAAVTLTSTGVVGDPQCTTGIGFSANTVGNIDVLAGASFNAEFVNGDVGGNFCFNFFNSSTTDAVVTLAVATVNQGGTRWGFIDGVQLLSEQLGTLWTVAQGTGAFAEFTFTIAANSTIFFDWIYGDPYAANENVRPEIDFVVFASPVPLPAGGLLLIGALGGLAALRRRKTV